LEERKKMAKNKDNTLIIVLVIGFLAALVIFDVGGIQSKLGMGVDNGEDKVDPTECGQLGITMTVGPMQEKWNPSTSMSSKGARVYVNDVDRGVFADKATLSVNYADKIDIYYGENETAGSAGYYTAHSSFNVPCTAAFSSADQDEKEKLVAQEAGTTLGFKLFCEDDGLLNAAGTTEDIDSGDVISMDFSIKPTFEDGWSPACPGVVVLAGNSSAFDELVIAGWKKVSVPNQHTLDSSEHKAWAYEVPIISLPASGAYNPIEGSLTVDSKVASLGSTSQFDLNVTFYDCDYYRDTNTGVMKMGVEDDSGSDVGGDNIHRAVFFT